MKYTMPNNQRTKNIIMIRSLDLSRNNFVIEFSSTYLPTRHPTLMGTYVRAYLIYLYASEYSYIITTSCIPILFYLFRS